MKTGRNLISPAVYEKDSPEKTPVRNVQRPPSEASIAPNYSSLPSGSMEFRAVEAIFSTAAR